MPLALRVAAFLLLPSLLLLACGGSNGSDDSTTTRVEPAPREERENTDPPPAAEPDETEPAENPPIPDPISDLELARSVLLRAENLPIISSRWLLVGESTFVAALDVLLEFPARSDLRETLGPLIASAPRVLAS